MEEIAAEFINGILSSDQQGNSLISGQSSQDADEHEKSINFHMNIMYPIYIYMVRNLSVSQKTI